MIKSYIADGKRKVNKKFQEIVSSNGTTSSQEGSNNHANDRINPADLFSLFTASIIKKKVKFTR
jgi:hypothetical protein